MYSEGTGGYLKSVQVTLQAGVTVDPTAPVHPDVLYERICACQVSGTVPLFKSVVSTAKFFWVTSSGNGLGRAWIEGFSRHRLAACHRQYRPAGQPAGGHRLGHRGGDAYGHRSAQRQGQGVTVTLAVKDIKKQAEVRRSLRARTLPANAPHAEFVKATVRHERAAGRAGPERGRDRRDRRTEGINGRFCGTAIGAAGVRPTPILPPRRTKIHLKEGTIMGATIIDGKGWLRHQGRSRREGQGTGKPRVNPCLAVILVGKTRQPGVRARGRSTTAPSAASRAVPSTCPLIRPRKTLLTEVKKRPPTRRTRHPLVQLPLPAQAIRN